MSEETMRAIKALIKELDEDEALSVYWELETQFGWAGSVFTRADAEQEWRDNQTDVETEDDSEPWLPDEVWEAAQNTRAWSRDLPERMTERGWDMVNQAVREAMNEDNANDDDAETA